MMNLSINKFLVKNRCEEYVPIWYVFKNREKIDLNKVLIEDFTGKYQRLRNVGQIEIITWQKLNRVLPKRAKLPLPNIIFYE